MDEFGGPIHSIFNIFIFSLNWIFSWRPKEIKKNLLILNKNVNLKYFTLSNINPVTHVSSYTWNWPHTSNNWELSTLFIGEPWSSRCHCPLSKKGSPIAFAFIWYNISRIFLTANIKYFHGPETFQAVILSCSMKKSILPDEFLLDLKYLITVEWSVWEY